MTDVKPSEMLKEAVRGYFRAKGYEVPEGAPVTIDARGYVSASYSTWTGDEYGVEYEINCDGRYASFDDMGAFLRALDGE
jgi:hypothetical protein